MQVLLWRKTYKDILWIILFIYFFVYIKIKIFELKTSFLSHSFSILIVIHNILSFTFKRFR